MQKLLISLLTTIISVAAIGQVREADTSVSRNTLPVEGGEIRMTIDSTTSLDSLLARLSGNWHFIETGKGYWIGYTNDMFSIAARGDSAIQPLVDLFEHSSDKKARIGVIYSLHLIGIDRNIAGRFYEEFVNQKARAALLKLLNYTEFQQTVITLLMRDPWTSDIPYIMKVMETNLSDCWSIIKALNRYNIIDPTLNRKIPENIKHISVTIKLPSDTEDIDNDTLLKKMLIAFKNLNNKLIRIENTLLNSRLTGDIITSYENPLTIEDIVGYDFIDYFFDYCDLGNRILYYVENGKIFICSPATAKKRWLAWWSKLSEDQKAEYDKTIPHHD